jgi:hypothetical protein
MISGGFLRGALAGMALIGAVVILVPLVKKRLIRPRRLSGRWTWVAVITKRSVELTSFLSAADRSPNGLKSAAQNLALLTRVMQRTGNVAMRSQTSPAG